MKVLFATDGREPALAAGTLIGNVADPKRVDMTVLSVVPTWHVRTHGPAAELLELGREQAAGVADAAVERFHSNGFSAVARTADGYPQEEILRATENERFDLVVVGGGQLTWLESHLLGSVSTHVLHSTRSSVLIVHDAISEEDPHVLIGVDGSAGSELAIRTFAGFADPARSQVTVVSVAQLPSPMFFAVPGAAYVPSYLEKLDRIAGKELFQQALRHADRARATLTDSGFDVKVDVVTGDPTHSLLSYAKAGGSDLVVVGSRGEGALRRAILGSVSDQIVRHAPATMVGRRMEG